MLFKPYHLPMIRSGSKTVTRREWAENYAGPKVGTVVAAKTEMLKPDDECDCFIRITDRYRQPLGQMTDEDAQAEGDYADLYDFKQGYEEVYGEDSFDPYKVVDVVEFEYVGTERPGEAEQQELLTDGGQDMEVTEQAKLSEKDQEQWRELHAVPHEDLSDEEVTSKIRLSVKRRFSGEWILMFEYGGQNGRVADAIAVNTVASRNYKIVGFEFKASRSDWLRELKDPEKADYFVRLCDEWYVVAPKGVIEQSEIPEGWGYLEMKPDSEQLYKLQDSELTDYQQGEPDRAFWIRFLKKTVGSESNYSKADLKEARSRGYEEAKTEYQKKSYPDVNVDRLRDKAESWDALRDRFDVLPWSRMSDDQLDTLELGYKLVQMVESDNYSSLMNEVERLEEDIERHYDKALEATDQLAEGVEVLQERVENGHVPEEVGGDD